MTAKHRLTFMQDMMAGVHDALRLCLAQTDASDELRKGGKVGRAKARCWVPSPDCGEAVTTENASAWVFALGHVVEGTWVGVQKRV